MSHSGLASLGGSRHTAYLYTIERCVYPSRDLVSRSVGVPPTLTPLISVSESYTDRITRNQ